MHYHPPIEEESFHLPRVITLRLILSLCLGSLILLAQPAQASLLLRYNFDEASGIAIDIDDIRAHGRDERIRVESFDRAVIFNYRLMKAFGGQ